jgi:serine/threonine protein kinase
MSEETNQEDVPGEREEVGAIGKGMAAGVGPDSVMVGKRSVLTEYYAGLGQRRQVTLRQAALEPDDPYLKLNSTESPVEEKDGRYQLYGEIARGGMGAIFKGRDSILGRDIAIKVLLDSHRNKPELSERFVEEAQIGGQLQHPGIVPVYELGQFSDDRPFFSMKLVKGKTLAKILSEREDPAQDQAKLIGVFEQVCQTMAYAHSRGVIHRDLKPANIMVGAFGEVQVMDWGLAKVLGSGGSADDKKSEEMPRDISVIRTRRSGGSDAPEGSTPQTELGSVLGTPAYMPPEQALGEVDQLDERADVFALGAILCEILTGKPPYVGRDMAEVSRLARRGNLGDCFARLEESGAEPDLKDLAKRMLAPETEKRPRNAGAVTERISAYLISVQKRLKDAELAKVEAQARAEEERRRRKLIIAIAALMVLVAGGSILAAGRFRQLAESEREALVKSERLVAELRSELTGKVFMALMSGDEKKVEAAIEQAEVAGVPASRVQFFRGQQALYYGRPEQAAKLLERAAGESIAARGMLSIACFYSLDLPNEDRALLNLRSSVKSSENLSFEDRLFAGQAMINDNMVLGLELVESALAEHDSPLARMIHAQTLAAAAHNTGDIAKAKQALDEIKVAMAFVRDTPCLLSTHHMVQHIALSMGLKAEAGISLVQLHDEWPKIQTLPAARMGLARLLADLDDETLPERIRSVPSVTDWEMNYFVPFLLADLPPEAVLEFTKSHSLGPYGEAAKARVLALLPEKRSEAQALCESLMQRYPGYGIRVNCLDTLFLLGKSGRARELAAKLLDSSVDDFWYSKRVMEFIAAPGDPQGFLDDAAKIGVWHVRALFTFAMHQLAEGKRDQAVDALRKCVSTGGFHSENYFWSRALLRAEETDAKLLP